ncbi:hypothetical protein FRC04_001623 [Tulasnella sp. 424]|nr:hypothetical protein FRC04_001623 [Tulasnella sp. 424]KAG8968650.1 hypothetical protein FRC05_001456 [Tulasnella sp. 425]
MAGKKRRTSSTAKVSEANEAGASTQMARVDPLAVPELLANVLSFATQSTLASCALACKSWSDVALDVLWRNLDSVFPLLEMLMGMELLGDLDYPSPNSLQRLSSRLSRADWSRFQLYAGRVRSLSYNDEDSYRDDPTVSRLPTQALAMLCFHRPIGFALLPNIENLKWSTSGSATSILPFLSPRVKYLEVELTGGVESVNDFFYALAQGRIPNLETFILKTPTPALDIEDSLQKVIGTWKILENLLVPPYYLRPSILGAAASLPNLKVLAQDYTHRPPYDLATTLKEFPQNAFPKLEKLGFNGNPTSAKQLASNYSSLFTRLEDIYLNAADGVNDAEVMEFVRHLGKNCPQLTAVLLDLCLSPGFRREGMSPLSVGVLEGLFPCRGLKTLIIGHPFPLTINENDVERMAAAWPELTILGMNEEPDLSLQTPGDTGNSLSILQAFAKHFPMMVELGLFFAQDQVPTFSGNLYPEFEFHHLKALRVGVSSVPGGRLHDVGFLIASLCKLEPEINVGVSDWYVGSDCPEWEEHRRQWEEASKFLEFAMRTKSACRAGIEGSMNS